MLSRSLFKLQYTERYSPFVLKVPLNPNQSISVSSNLCIYIDFGGGDH